MYQQVYFHRTVRAIDLDLAEVFGPSIRAIFGDGSPAERLADYADLDEYALLHQAARWARGERRRGQPGGPGTARSRRDRRRPGGRSSCASRAGAPRPRSAPSTSRRPARGRWSPSSGAGAGHGRDRPRHRRCAARGRAATDRLLGVRGSRRRSRIRRSARRSAGCRPSRSSGGATAALSERLAARSGSGRAGRRVRRPALAAAWSAFGRTSSGSIRAICAARQPHPLDDRRGRSANVAVSSGLNRP